MYFLEESAPYSFIWLSYRSGTKFRPYVSTCEVCSKSIRIGIVVVVQWVGCVCNQS